MISKITAILAAALALGSAGAASAQTHRHAGWQAPYANSYKDTRNLRYGHANDTQFDPLVQCAPRAGQFYAAVLTVCRA
jgi:hypothetical protein